MKNFILHLLHITFISALFACNDSSTKSEETTDTLKKISLKQEWFPNSNYAGALFSKYEFAKSNGLDLTIVAGGEAGNPVSTVIQGECTFGDASADNVLDAIEKGADLVIIGVISYNSPTCFLAKEEKKIYTPKDFEGKRVGILPGTNTEYIYRTLIKKERLNYRKIKEVTVPFDLQSFIVSDDYDVRPAYIYDEPVSLDLNKIKYTVIEPRNYGVKFLGTVYFTTRKYVKENPETVQAFINSVADGWTAAIKYPERAISLLKIHDNTIDSSRELLSLKKGLDYYRGKNNKILWAGMSDWEEMVSSLKDLGKLKKVDLTKIVDNSFLQHYHATH